jgi:hypothetical protein
MYDQTCNLGEASRSAYECLILTADALQLCMIKHDGRRAGKQAGMQAGSISLPNVTVSDSLDLAECGAGESTLLAGALLLLCAGGGAAT